MMMHSVIKVPQSPKIDISPRSAFMRGAFRRYSHSATSATLIYLTTPIGAGPLERVYPHVVIRESPERQLWLPSMTIFPAFYAPYPLRGYFFYSPTRPFWLFIT